MHEITSNERKRERKERLGKRKLIGIFALHIHFIMYIYQICVCQKYESQVIGGNSVEHGRVKQVRGNMSFVPTATQRHLSGGSYPMSG